jgi:hypothetical protein
VEAHVEDVMEADAEEERASACVWWRNDRVRVYGLRHI